MVNGIKINRPSRTMLLDRCAQSEAEIRSAVGVDSMSVTVWDMKERGWLGPAELELVGEIERINFLLNEPNEGTFVQKAMLF